MPDLPTLLMAADRWLFLWINQTLQNPVCDLLMPAVSDKRYAVLPALVLAAVLAIRGGRRAWAWFAIAALAVAGADGAGNLLKHATERIRPCHVEAGVRLMGSCTLSFAMPSNHAANTAAVAMVGWLGLPRWGWLLTVLAALVGFSRVYLGVHYPGDVLVGAALGATLGGLLVLAVRRVWPQIFGGRFTGRSDSADRSDEK
ncbi:MAG: phosphatase PAP2 family protein [Candidatus Methylomirabilota bacterium]